MRVLIACEFSGRVRDAFIARGHDAMSCDILPTTQAGPHYQGDVRDVLDYPWDLMIAHPPCTHLSVSGARHFAEKKMDGRQQRAISFFMHLAKTDIPQVAIENPICIMSSLWRKPDQIIQPHMFGHPETKATCLWLKGLPALSATNQVEVDYMKKPDGSYYVGKRGERYSPIHFNTNPTFRSLTYLGVADAMAEQWGGRA